jgi:glycosyltransferase involved in cell wall biosynthesis
MRREGPSISFAIPYYSNAAYLLEAIASVRAQTVDDWELIVVDDAGPEPAAEAVEALGDARISYVRNAANLGLAANWNECVRLSRAPLVNVLHADDRLKPTYAARVLAAARTHSEVAAVFTDVTIIGSDGKRTVTMADLGKRFVRRRKDDHVIMGDDDLAGLLKGNYILCPTLCLRKAVVGDAPFDPRWRFVPDLDFTAQQLLAGRALCSIREPLLEYRRHTGSQTSVLTDDASRFEEEIEFSREMAELTAVKGWIESATAARRRVLLRGHLALRAGVDLIHGRVRAAGQKRRILWGDLRHRDRVGADDADAQQ